MIKRVILLELSGLRHIGGIIDIPNDITLAYRLVQFGQVFDLAKVEPKYVVYKEVAISPEAIAEGPKEVTS